MTELARLAHEDDYGDAFCLPDCYFGLLLAIEEAESQDRLSDICVEVDLRYQEGRLALGQAEELAELSARRARGFAALELPGCDLVAADLLATGDPACPCCGNTSWWHDQGRRICSECHPHPAIRVPAARNAA
jgi:hypothetical protein